MSSYLLGDLVLPLKIIYKDNKNMYLRIKDNNTIYITAPRFIKKKDVLKFIKKNESTILKIIDLRKEKQEERNKFLFLGKTYEINYITQRKLILGQDKVYLAKDYNYHNWYRKMAEEVFLRQLNYCYSRFTEKIPYPQLKIRSMKSKWGVCNITKKKVTINLELIKYDLKYLNYVIIHELAHLVYPNHSKSFWALVAKYEPNYKKYRKEMKSFSI